MIDEARAAVVTLTMREPVVSASSMRTALSAEGVKVSWSGALWALGSRVMWRAG